MTLKEAPSDNELILFIKNNPLQRERAFNLLYKKYNNSLTRFCARRMRSVTLVEDIVQSTWEQFYYAIFKVNKIESPCCYLFRIARNNIYRYYKEISCAIDYNLEIENIEIIDSDADIVYNITIKEIQRQFVDSIGEMSYKTRICLVLYYIEDLSYCEISDKLDLSYECVRKRCERGFRHIKNQLLDN